MLSEDKSFLALIVTISKAVTDLTTHNITMMSYSFLHPVSNIIGFMLKLLFKFLFFLFFYFYLQQ